MGCSCFFFFMPGIGALGTERDLGKGLGNEEHGNPSLWLSQDQLPGSQIIRLSLENPSLGPSDLPSLMYVKPQNTTQASPCLFSNHSPSSLSYIEAILTESPSSISFPKRKIHFILIPQYSGKLRRFKFVLG